MTRQMIQSWDEYRIHAVHVPMAPPLRWINSYILQGNGEITLVDPGPRTNESIATWEQALGELGIQAREITSIVVTHHHPDHYGLAGYMQSRSGAKVYMSRRAYEESQLMWGKGQRINEELTALFRQHGMPDTWLALLPGHLDSFLSQVEPQPEIISVADGEILRLGDRSWTAIETAGHAPGHLSFYEDGQGIILCGDAVLPQISPNISLLPGSDPNPLHSFLQSLDKLKDFRVSVAFPGHRNPFSGFAERIDRLLLHHEERLEMIEALLDDGERSGFDICEALFGTELGIHQMRFAMAETLAHLFELVRRGRLEISNSSSHIRFGSKRMKNRLE
ncbi:MBL fold metallo-hydrolase [Paenibacillus brevis]|uniref:MBL fold metallo-hydrolase n=1 Tax=Paenibacillus brevis TaxID=2841508 RepID=A0ABS6FXH0_9BACL|nr:MBL fold metallo-hydrolase [Paenibacillus brevis]MBU5674098.1 MBL fold metallo-hydrolase [Paenibacillus brevis]